MLSLSHIFDFAPVSFEIQARERSQQDSRKRKKDKKSVDTSKRVNKPKVRAYEDELGNWSVWGQSCFWAAPAGARWESFDARRRLQLRTAPSARVTFRGGTHLLPAVPVRETVASAACRGTSLWMASSDASSWLRGKGIADWRNESGGELGV